MSEARSDRSGDQDKRSDEDLASSTKVVIKWVGDPTAEEG